MGRPKIHDDALRGRLIDHAAALVFDGGVDALNLRRLAAGAGTSTSAVYSLFGNKAGLLESLYLEAARRFGLQMSEVVASGDPVGDIVRLGIAYRDYALREPHLYAIMFDRQGPGIDDRARDEAAATIAPLVDAVRRGQDTGVLRKVAPELVALSCWGVAHGLVSLELAGSMPPGLDVASGYEDALRAMVDGWRQSIVHSPN
jgi:AcrR family transcriptional regulator